MAQSYVELDADLASSICDAYKDINGVLFLSRDGKRVNVRTYMVKKNNYLVTFKVRFNDCMTVLMPSDAYGDFTSLSSCSTNVMFPETGSTLKYSLEPGSKEMPYLTSWPSGSVPLRL